MRESDAAEREPRLAEAWARCHNVLEQSLARGEATAFAVAARRFHRPLGHLSLGDAHKFRAPEGVPGPLALLPKPEPVTHEHAFDWASLTKALGGQLLTLQLLAKGVWQWHTPLCDVLPAFRAPTLERITVRQALSYCAGFPAWRPLYALQAAGESKDAVIARQGLVGAPGEHRLYSDLGHMALGLALEELLAGGLAAAFDARVARALQLQSVGYLPAHTLRAPCVATSHGNVYERRMMAEADFGMPAAQKGWGEQPLRYEHFRDHTIVGEVDDGNAHYFLGGVSAHAGLFGTAQDLATLAEAMVLGYADEALGLTPEIRQQGITADERGHLPSWWHGAELDLPIDRPAAGEPAPAVMLRGFAGTCVFVEPGLGLTVAILANREHVDGFGHYINLRPTLRDVVHLFRQL